ncbi:hypothetical protein SUGI_0965840 [Cryptomeria japonica]|nr:hypothetical protein SUGI_0965840 [Cryptomeria japonica]
MQHPGRRRMLSVEAFAEYKAKCRIAVSGKKMKQGATLYSLSRFGKALTHRIHTSPQLALKTIVHRGTQAVLPKCRSVMGEIAWA